MEINIEKKHIYIATVVVILLFLFMAGSCSEEEKTVEKTDEKIEKTIIFSGDEEIKKIDFKQFKIGSGKPVAPENKLDYKGEEAMPMKMKKIMDLLSAHKFREAEAMILQMEKNASASDMTYLIYFKAQIYYLSGDYNFAKVFFKEFVRMYPNHRLAENARKALRYIDVRKFK